MKKFIVMTILIVLAFITQTSFMVFLNYFNVIPSIPLILLVIFAMLTDGLTGGILGFMTGLLYDAMVYDIFGIYTLIYFFIGALIGSLSDDMLRENYLAYSTVTGVSTLFMHSFLYLILFFLRFRVDSVGNILPAILIESVLNSLLVILILRFVLYLFDKFNLKA